MTAHRKENICILTSTAQVIGEAGEFGLGGVMTKLAENTLYRSMKTNQGIYHPLPLA
jgi:hypothetical protein